jgi:DNA-binding XRE family transcriptional regulator
MPTATIPNRIHQRTEFTYPPRVFNTKIGELMHEQGFTDPWLGNLLGVTPTTANRIKNGCDLKLSHAVKIAAYFKLSVESLWTSM